MSDEQEGYRAYSVHRLGNGRLVSWGDIACLTAALALALLAWRC